MGHVTGHVASLSLKFLHVPAASGSVAFRYTAEVDDVGNLHSLSAVKKSGRTIGRCIEMPWIKLENSSCHGGLVVLC